MAKYARPRSLSGSRPRKLGLLYGAQRPRADIFRHIQSITYKYFLDFALNTNKLKHKQSIVCFGLFLPFNPYKLLLANYHLHCIIVMRKNPCFPKSRLYVCRSHCSIVFFGCSATNFVPIITYSMYFLIHVPYPAK